MTACTLTNHRLPVVCDVPRGEAIFNEKCEVEHVLNRLFERVWVDYETEVVDAAIFWVRMLRE